MYLRRPNRRQGGYVLLAILFALTVLIIGLAVAAPRASAAVQRQKEGELIRRGEQYALAIRRFYKKFGRYPSNIDQLENTNNIRFLRRRYLDPLTGKDDWTPIQFGQARPSLGFFGQKVTNVGGGLSPSGPGLGPSTIGTGLGGNSTNSSSSISSSNAGTSAASSDNSSTASSGSTGAGATGTTGPTGASGATGTAGNPITSSQLGGTTFGGGAIVGVSVPSQKESLKEFQQKNHYNEWQFVYDPTMDPTLRGLPGGGAGAGIPSGAGIGLNPNTGIGSNPTSPGTTTNPTSPTGPGPTTTPATTPSNPQ